MRRKGIDVSEYDGRLDWDSVKRNGIEFAIIRASWGHFAVDEQFRRNVRECERLGIPYGLYHYSYVSNDEEMAEEARGFIRQCKSCKPLYPCYIDMEDADGWKRRRGVSDEMDIKVCRYTCLELEKAGFYAGIYASLDWLEHRIDSPRLDRFDKWVAQWGPVNTYNKEYGMWQYTSSGRLSGIDLRFDMDYAYKDYPAIMKRKGLNGWEKDEHVKPEPPDHPNRPKYPVGTPVTYTGLWTQSNGGNWYPRSKLAVKEGIITRIVEGAQHPYLINDGVGWADDKVIDDEPTKPTGY